DTHQGQVNTQLNLLTQVGQAMKAFYDATVELAVESRVVTFTLSDFGRTLQPAGSMAGTVGSDHAWGNHHLVMGASVIGRDLYGGPGTKATVLPPHQFWGPEPPDTHARWIPTAAVDQYAATPAAWFGVSDPTLNPVFQELKNFPLRNPGFKPPGRFTHWGPVI